MPNQHKQHTQNKKERTLFHNECHRMRRWQTDDKIKCEHQKRELKLRSVTQSRSQFSTWEFPLPWCQITAQTLSPTNSKLFCLITSSHMYTRPWVIISQMVWWNTSSKNLRSISNSVMQPARPMFCALLPTS